jgi:hypothetical protein
MSFNLDKLNMTCAPMYNAQNTNQVLGYMCNLKKNGKEGFQNTFLKLNTPEFTQAMNNLKAEIVQQQLSKMYLENVITIPQPVGTGINTGKAASAFLKHPTVIAAIKKFVSEMDRISKIFTSDRTPQGQNNYNNSAIAAENECIKSINYQLILLNDVIDSEKRIYYNKIDLLAKKYNLNPNSLRDSRLIFQPNNEVIPNIYSIAYPWKPTDRNVIHNANGNNLVPYTDFQRLVNRKISVLMKCMSHPNAALFPNYDLPKSFPSPSYNDKNMFTNSLWPLNQTLKYDNKKIINSFDSGIKTNNPGVCNANYWIPLFYQSNLTGAVTGYPDANVMSLFLSVNDRYHPNYLIVPESENTIQGISNYNNIMAWFAQYPTLKPGFMISFTQVQYGVPVHKSFYVNGADPSNKEYANLTSFTPKYSYTNSDGTPVEPAGYKRIDDDSGENVLMFYLGTEGKKFWDKYVDENLNYFDDSNINLFGQQYQGTELSKVPIEVRVCAILPNGELYNWNDSSMPIPNL